MASRLFGAVEGISSGDDGPPVLEQSLPPPPNRMSRRPCPRRIQILPHKRPTARRHRMPSHGSDQDRGANWTCSSRRQQPEPRLSKVVSWVQCIPIHRHRVAVGVAAGVAAVVAAQAMLQAPPCPRRVCQRMMMRLSACTDRPLHGGWHRRHSFLDDCTANDTCRSVLSGVRMRLTTKVSDGLFLTL